MAKNARKIVEDLFKSELAHAESLQNGPAKYEALNRVQRNIDNGVRQVVDFLNAKGGQDWQHASDDEIRDAVFGSKRYKPNEFSVMLQDKENEERNKSIMQSDAMKVTGTTPYVNDRTIGDRTKSHPVLNALTGANLPLKVIDWVTKKFPIEGETSNFAWQDMDPTQIKLAMAKAGYHDSTDPKQREDFMRRLSEASIAANRGEILNDWDNSTGYNIALAPWNTLNDEGRKQIATGKGDKSDMALAAGADVVANELSLMAPNKFALNGVLNPVWQVGSEGVRQAIEANPINPVGDEEFNAEAMKNAGAASATVPGLFGGALAVAHLGGRMGGDVGQFLRGMNKSVIGDEAGAALDVLKKNLTKNGATTDYAFTAAKNPRIKIWNNNAKTVQYSAPKQAYEDDLIHYPTTTGQELPEGIRGLDKDGQLTKGTEWQLRTPQEVYNGTNVNDLTPEAVYWRDMARAKLADAQKAGDKEAEAYFSKVVKAFEPEGTLDPKTGYYTQAKSKSKENIETIEKFIDDVRFGNIKLDTEFTPVTPLSSGAETRAADTIRRNAQTQHILSSLKGTENVYEPKSTGFKAAGEKVGQFLQTVGGKVEPTMLEGGSAFSLFDGSFSTGDYKLQPWYKHLNDEQKEAIDDAYEAKLKTWAK